MCGFVKHEGLRKGGLYHNGQFVDRAEELYPDESRHGDDLIK